MYRVDPELLNSTAGTIETAATRLAGASEMLEGIHNRLQSSATMSQDSKADNRFDTFHDRWKDEFKILREMMSGFTKALRSTSEAYTTADREVAQALTAPPQAPVDERATGI
jgi:WXG100 family type VII secretion target